MMEHTPTARYCFWTETMQPNTKRLILNLILAQETKNIAVQDLIMACDLFGIKANGVRVTVQRLVNKGLLIATERGMYQLGPEAKRFAKGIVQWRKSLQQLTAWKHDWIGVQCAELGRVDRKALKERERALLLNGFRELTKDFYIRPNNIKGELQSVCSRLHSFGLEEKAMVFNITEFDRVTQTRIPPLWEREKLEKNYRLTREALSNWLDNADYLPLHQAATESFILGDQAIRQMVYDPLLPDPMINSRERELFLNVLIQFDDVGNKIWRSVLDTTGYDRAQA